MFAKIAGLIVSTSSGPRINLGGDPMRAQIAPSVLSAPPPVDHFLNTVNKYTDYIANPPPDITPEKTKNILDWAIHQKERLNLALAQTDVESDRYSELEEKRIDIDCLIDSAKDSIYQQSEFSKFEGKLSGVISGGDSVPVKIAPSVLSSPPVDNFLNAVNKYTDYIANPPPDITPEKTKKILDWAVRQKERLNLALAQTDVESDRYSELEERRIDIDCLIDSAKDSVYQQDELLKYERKLSGLD